MKVCLGELDWNRHIGLGQGHPHFSLTLTPRNGRVQLQILIIPQTGGHLTPGPHLSQEYGSVKRANCEECFIRVDTVVTMFDQNTYNREPPARIFDEKALSSSEFRLASKLDNQMR